MKRLTIQMMCLLHGNNYILMQISNIIGKWTVSYTSINNKDIYFDKYKFTSDKLYVDELIQASKRIQKFCYQYEYNYDSLDFRLVNSSGEHLEFKLEILSDNLIKIIKKNNDYTILERQQS
jgi:hypothetical protein